jgi:hypothetical protein
MPEAFKGMSKDEIEKKIVQLTEERSLIKKELAEMEKKMALYMAEESNKQSGDTETLDNVLIQTVVEQAIAKGFSFPK